MNFFSKGKSGDSHASSNASDPLDEVIYTFNNGKDCLTLRDLVTGSLTQGSSSSGKSSGFNHGLLQSLFKANYGGVALSVKQSFSRYFLKTAEKMRRKVIHFHSGSDLTFNPLEYEIIRQGGGQIEINNLTNLIILLCVLVGNYKAGGAGGKGGDDRFWLSASEKLINRAILLLLLAKLPVTFYNIRKIVASTFHEQEADRYHEIWSVLLDENVSPEKKSETYDGYQNWMNSNFFLSVFHTANSREDLNSEDYFQMELCGEYFLKTYPRLAPKTKSIVEESVSGLFENFNYGIMKSHFSEGVSEELLPENTYQKGDIILIDFSIKQFGLSGILANALYKYIWQTAMERRQTETEEAPKPAFLFADEFHNLINPNYDQLFQATARESLAITVYITQSLPSIIGAFGTENPENRAKSMIANLGLKVFCANSDYDTNEFASQMIGQHFIDVSSISIDKDKNANRSYSQQLQWKVPPEHFFLLKTGGPKNKYTVESILVKAGKQWSNGENYLPAEFNQLD